MEQCVTRKGPARIPSETCLKPVRNSPESIGNPLETHWKPIGNPLETCWKPVGNPLEIHWKSVGNLTETLWKPSRHSQLRVTWKNIKLTVFWFYSQFRDRNTTNVFNLGLKKCNRPATAGSQWVFWKFPAAPSLTDQTVYLP